MTKENANEMFPIWASAEAVRIVDDPEKKPEEETPWKLKMNLKQEKFIKRYGFAIGFVFAMAVYSVLLCVITGTVVRRNTIDEMEHQYRAQMQAYIEQQEQERMASSLVTGEESRKAAMDLEAREIARVLYGIKDNSENDLRTAVWCILNRVDNPGYPGNIYQVCAQSQQWMGYSPENPVLDNLYKIAMEELTTWYNGTRPVDSAFVYLNWTPSKITLRNAWENNSDTEYWRYGK